MHEEDIITLEVITFSINLTMTGKVKFEMN